MGVIEEIKRLQLEGKQEQEIVKNLQERGYGSQEIYEAMSQAKIKEAVNAAENDFPSSPSPDAIKQQLAAGMQPSLLTATRQDIEQENTYKQQGETAAPAQQTYPEYTQQYAQLPAASNYQEYQQYGSSYSAASADTITEIAEQIVAENMQQIRHDLEKVLDLKTTLETKMENLDERLKRIEKIIDRLQLSILQKVGDYLTNVEDVKRELQETQKSFKSLLPELKNNSSS